MKKFFGLMLLCATVGVFYSCEKNPDSSRKTYNIGDIVSHNGVPAIVIIPYNETTQQGLMMSLEETNCSWIDAYTWCVDMGCSWRLPLKRELRIVRDNIDKINNILQQEGKTLLGKDYYWSIEEVDWDFAYVVYMGKSSGGYSRDYYSRDYNYKVRAVHAFK